jgi:hypothetical protein
MLLEEIPLSRLIIEPATAVDISHGKHRGRPDGDKTTSTETLRWVNLTHPSQMRDEVTRYRVKSFITKTRKKTADIAEAKEKVLEEQNSGVWPDDEFEFGLEDTTRVIDPNSGPRPYPQVSRRPGSRAWPLYKDSNIGKLRVECIESYPAKETPRLSRALEFCQSICFQCHFMQSDSH